MFAFTDYKDEVVFMMQKLNHATRAYIWNADGLPGYLEWDQNKGQRMINILEHAE